TLGSGRWMTPGILPFALRAVPLRGTFKIVPDNFCRTTEGVSQQIYSLPPLAAWVSLQQRTRIVLIGPRTVNTLGLPRDAQKPAFRRMSSVRRCDVEVDQLLHALGQLQQLSGLGLQPAFTVVTGLPVRHRC